MLLKRDEKMSNKRGDTILAHVNKEDISMLEEYKKLCMGLYGNGGIKKRIVEIIKEDFKKLEKENK